MSAAKSAKILVVDDEPAVLRVLELILLSKDYEVVAVPSGQEAQKRLEKERFDLLISDIVMEPITGVDLFHMARLHQPDIPAIMISGYATMDISIDAIRDGVFDCLTKPFPPDQFLAAVDNALAFSRKKGEGIDLKKQPGEAFYYAGLIAENAKMRRVCDFVKRVAPMDIPILVIGESGVGKELIARTIHGQGSRKDRDFLAVNCANLPAAFFDSLFRSEPRPGASGAPVGTVLLKEIGLMPIELQDKLVQILEERTSAKGARSFADVRILGCTMRTLDSSIQDGTFRQSLHRYFSVISIAVPPLKERKEDILPLVTYFLRQKVRDASKLPTLTMDAHDALELYPWPGNVRELREAMDAALASAQAGRIELKDLPQSIVEVYKSRTVRTAGKGQDTRGQFLKESFKTAVAHTMEEPRVETKPADPFGGPLPPIQYKR